MMLHVSRSRAVQLSNQRGFPEPLDVLTMGQVWALDDLITWADANGRTLDLQALRAPHLEADADSKP
ncbi:DNA-binding protein [Nakamurella endophytica]|nr:DNA-binding protein [Nakamurella endophytica]